MGFRINNFVMGDDVESRHMIRVNTDPPFFFIVDAVIIIT